MIFKRILLFNKTIKLIYKLIIIVHQEIKYEEYGIWNDEIAAA